ncbi:MAG: HNH endonuclease [Candidatus Bathyarchaeota archaeon]
MNRFRKLQNREAEWSGSIREYVREAEKPGECIYCGSKEKLTLEHILPSCRGGPDMPDNAIWACSHCNSSKGGKRLYEWKGLGSKDSIARIAEGKYLKLLYQLHKEKGTLDKGVLCSECDFGEKCPKKAKLTVYCLEGCFKKA